MDAVRKKRKKRLLVREKRLHKGKAIENPGSWLRVEERGRVKNEESLSYSDTMSGLVREWLTQTRALASYM